MQKSSDENLPTGPVPMSRTLPRLFLAPKIALGTFVIIVKNGHLKSTPKGIDPKIQCTIRVEGGAGETDPTSNSKSEWNTEFRFPVSEYETSIDVLLGSSRVDLVTQETRWIREGSATIDLELKFFEGKKESVSYEAKLKKGGKGKPIGIVNFSVRYVPNPNPYAPLQNLLLSSNKMVQGLIELDKAGEDQGEVGKALLIIFWFNQMERKLIQLCVDNEIRVGAKNGVEDVTLLLRGPTLSIAILAEYMLTICEPYLCELFVPLIKPISSGASRFEIDPGRLQPRSPESSAEAVPIEKALKKNQKNLNNVASKFFKNIIHSANKLPPDIGELCRMLKVAIDARYPENSSAWNVAAGALIFLRFICPAIVAPDTYGLIQGECGAEGRRCLILLTKVLQNLVNDVDFGYKEAYMSCMNPFIEKNRSQPNSFYTGILKKKPGFMLDPKIVARGVSEETYKVLWAAVVKCEEALSAMLTDEELAVFKQVAKEVRDGVAEQEARRKSDERRRKAVRTKSGGVRGSPSQTSRSDTLRATTGNVDKLDKNSSDGAAPSSQKDKPKSPLSDRASLKESLAPTDITISSPTTPKKGGSQVKETNNPSEVGDDLSKGEPPSSPDKNSNNTT